MEMSLNIGIIGYGEVGQIFARDLLKNGATRVTVWDRLFGTPVAEERIARARELGIEIAESAAEAAADADVVISAVTADQARAVALEAAGYLEAGQVLFDVNSASPDTKIASAKVIEAAGAEFMEGAVMATVPGPDLAVPILGGGRCAVQMAEKLNALGMNITPVSEETGRASAMKLCRSIMIKGIEALIIQCKDASTKWDVEEYVFNSLKSSYPGIDWPKLATDMRKRVNQHGVRRSAEMREAAQMVEALGLNPSLMNGVADVQFANAINKS
jgi:3-hydroxyisobutyrate dehydrogenase-like beta-hydroxyacid dehydrogenase